MNSALGLVVAVFILTIGEIIIYNVAWESNLPFILKIIAILIIPVAGILAIIARFRSNF